VRYKIANGDEINKLGSHIISLKKYLSVRELAISLKDNPSQGAKKVATLAKWNAFNLRRTVDGSVQNIRFAFLYAYRGRFGNTRFWTTGCSCIPPEGRRMTRNKLGNKKNMHLLFLFVVNFKPGKPIGCLKNAW